MRDDRPVIRERLYANEVDHILKLMEEQGGYCRSSSSREGERILMPDAEYGGEALIAILFRMKEKLQHELSECRYLLDGMGVPSKVDGKPMELAERIKVWKALQ